MDSRHRLLFLILVLVFRPATCSPSSRPRTGLMNFRGRPGSAPPIDPEIRSPGMQDHVAAASDDLLAIIVRLLALVYPLIYAPCRTPPLGFSRGRARGPRRLRTFRDPRPRAQHRGGVRRAPRPGLVAFYAIGALHDGLPGVTPLRRPHQLVDRHLDRRSRRRPHLRGDAGRADRSNYGVNLAPVTLGFGEIVASYSATSATSPSRSGLSRRGGPRRPECEPDGGNVGINPIDPPISRSRVRGGPSRLLEPERDRVVVPGPRPPRPHLFHMPRLRDSKLGRAWMAIREDETAAAADGHQHRHDKLLAFSLGAASRASWVRSPGPTTPRSSRRRSATTSRSSW